MIEIEVRLRDLDAAHGRGLIVPIPFDTWDQTYLGCEIEGAEVTKTVQALNSGQSCYWIRAFSVEDFRLVYRFERRPGASPDWLWALPADPFTPSPELAAQAREVVGHSREPIRSLVDHAIDRFHYGHPVQSILRSEDAVPALCGLTEGSCVDIHTWFISALGAVGSEATYLHGYYFRNHQTSPGFHCWLATREGARVENWDLSHTLIFDRKPAGPGFEDFPGERVVIGAGKNIDFDLDGARVRCPILCHPAWVGAEGQALRVPVDVRRLG